MNNHVLEAFENFVPRPCDAWMFEDEMLRQGLVRQIINFPCFVMPYVDCVTAIGGIIHSHGVGCAWLITGEGFRRTSPIVAGQLGQLCKSSFDVLNLHRLHMQVDSDDPKAKYFAERLGFVCEAPRLKGMGARGNDMDMYLFERIKK